MVEVSVVMPVYNVEKYLSESLDSILNQTFRDIEIICVNDGSSDNSLKILEDYQKNDSRIKIITQSNNGAASARNVGIEKSIGKYVYFMDSDDILELNALEELHALAENRNLDLVIFKLINFDDGTSNKYPNGYYEMKFLKEMVGENTFNYKDIGVRSFSIAVSPPGKLFKKDLISDIRFPEGYIFEDNAFFTEAILKAKAVCFYDKHLYNRRVRSDSVMGNRDIKQADIIPVFNIMIDIVDRLNCLDEFKAYLLEYKLRTIMTRYNMVDDIYRKEFFKRIKNDFKTNEKDFDEVINEFSNKNKKYYENVLESDTYKEFELKVKIDEMAQKNKRLEKDISDIKTKNKALKKEIKNNRMEYEEILNSNSLKITKPLRSITNLFK